MTVVHVSYLSRVSPYLFRIVSYNQITGVHSNTCMRMVAETLFRIKIGEARTILCAWPRFPNVYHLFNGSKRHGCDSGQLGSSAPAAYAVRQSLTGAAYRRSIRYQCGQKK